MASSEAASVCAAAARNNAEWCASVCRSHGISSTFRDAVWACAGKPPPYYPDIVTLHPDATRCDLPSEIDGELPDCSVKDSFAALDLNVDGFHVLFAATWIYHPPGARRPLSTLRAEPVRTSAQLRDWQTAWHGGNDAPDVFRATLLDDPSVQILNVFDGAARSGGVILNYATGLVGLSNLFTVDADKDAVWSAALNAATYHSPGAPVVGYVHGDDLKPALAAGFTTPGSLRVWQRGS